jgi:hypothetical protein
MYPVSSTTGESTPINANGATHHEVEFSCNVCAKTYQRLPQCVVQIESFDRIGKTL